MSSWTDRLISVRRRGLRVPQKLADDREPVLRHRTEAGLPRDDPLGAEHQRQPFANRLEAIDHIRFGSDGGRVKGQRDDIGEGRDVSAPVRARKDFNRNQPAAFLLNFEEQRIRGNIRSSFVDKARTSLPEDGWK